MTLVIPHFRIEKKAHWSFWIRWEAAYNIMVSLLRNDDVTCLSMCHCTVFIFPLGWNGVCELNRIHHWCSVGQENPNPRTHYSSWKLGKLRWTWGLGFSCNHWTTIIDYFSHIPILLLAKYCLVFVGDVTGLMFTVARATVKRSLVCWPNYHSLK